MEDKSPEEVNLTEGLLNKIKLHLLDYYTPVFHPKDAEFHYTTYEVYEQLVKLFPTPMLTTDLVAQWLHLGGFSFVDFGEMRFEWLFKKA